MNWFFSKNKEKQTINFENMQFAIKNNNDFIIINTLESDNQDCLIKNTILASDEEKILNKMLTDYNEPDKNIILYGKNANDNTVDEKYDQLINMGSNVYIYSGGLFEWLLLQDIYGVDEFTTTSRQLDILKYKPRKTLHAGLIGYYAS